MTGLTVSYGTETEPSGRGTAELALMIHIVGCVNLAYLSFITSLQTSTVNTQDIFWLDLEFLIHFSFALSATTAVDSRATVALIHSQLEHCVFFSVLLVLTSLLEVFIIVELLSHGKIVSGIIYSSFEVLLIGYQILDGGAS